MEELWLGQSVGLVPRRLELPMVEPHQTDPVPLERLRIGLRHRRADLSGVLRIDLLPRKALPMSEMLQTGLRRHHQLDLPSEMLRMDRLRTDQRSEKLQRDC